MRTSTAESNATLARLLLWLDGMLSTSVLPSCGRVRLDKVEAGVVRDVSGVAIATEAMRTENYEFKSNNLKFFPKDMSVKEKAE